MTGAVMGACAPAAHGWRVELAHERQQRLGPNARRDPREPLADRTREQLGLAVARAVEESLAASLALEQPAIV
jgi:hypothetical protein